MSYLSQLVRVDDLSGRRSLRSARTNRLLVLPEPWNCLPSAAGPSQSPDPPFGTVCRTMWSLLRVCRPSVSVCKHFCSRPRSPTLSSSISVKLFPAPSVDPEVVFVTWITLKIHDWLIDWTVRLIVTRTGWCWPVNVFDWSRVQWRHEVKVVRRGVSCRKVNWPPQAPAPGIARDCRTVRSAMKKMTTTKMMMMMMMLMMMMPMQVYATVMCDGGRSRVRARRRVVLPEVMTPYLSTCPPVYLWWW